MQIRFTGMIAAGLSVALVTLGATGCNPDRSPVPETTGTGDAGGGGVGGDGQGGQGAQGGEGGAGGGQGGAGGGQGGAGGGQGGAGGGGPPECTTPGQCPTPQNACEVATCTAGVCGTAPVPAGTLSAAQTAGDCLRVVCDSSGGTVPQADDNDPPDDGIDCTADACSDGTPSHLPEPDGTSCNDGGVACDGSGQCLPAVCGDGALEGAEVCDDGNTVSGDGCGAICTVEPGFTCTSAFPRVCYRLESEPNNTCGGAPLIIPSSSLRMGGSIVPSSDADFFSFVVPATASVEIETFTSLDTETCTSDGDTLLELRGQDCATALATNDDSGISPCSRISPDNDTAARRLAPGTYYVHVEEHGNDESIPQYSLRIRFPSLCGNGTVEPYEDCDDGNLVDGDACQADCTWPTCGDGIVQPGEECEDGNQLSGDGCSACLFDPGFNCTGTPSVCVSNTDDTEPNETCGQAGDAILLMPNASVVGQISAWGDRDYYAFVVPVTSTIDIKAFSGTTPGACASIQTVVTLWNPDCSGSISSGSAMPNCSISTPQQNPDLRRVAPGTYFISVRGYLNAIIPAYNLSISLTSMCGNGVLEPYEECDDGNLVSGDGCQLDCSWPSVCGDGIVEPDEGCDDGNQAAGDGCAACAVEPGYACAGGPSDCNLLEIEPNDSCATAQGPFDPLPGVVIPGAISPATDVDIFSFTVPATASVNIETFSGHTPGYCTAIDTQLELRGQDCSTVIDTQDQGGLGKCAKITARRLAPGTYFVEAEEHGRDAVIGAYNTRIAVVALCGNAVLEPFEQCDDGNLTDGDGCQADCSLTSVCGNGLLQAGEACDDGNLTDGDGCQADCTLFPVCGDGLLQSGEECDDGGLVAGDGCSAGCTIEPGFTCAGSYPSTCGKAEVEPNNSRPQAEARAANPSPVLLTHSGRITGSIAPSTDLDIYVFNLASASTVRFQVFDGNGTTCSDVDNAVLHVSTPASGWVGWSTQARPPSCAALVLSLPAGSYFVYVESSAGVIPAYQLEAAIHESIGAESEPNETVATADLLQGSNVVMQGEISSVDDADFFAIVVPTSGMSVMAEIASQSMSTCVSGNDVDLMLFDAYGVQLAQHPNENFGSCAKIDGQGGAQPGAHALAAGTYHLRVRSALGSWIGGYKLAVSLHGP